MSARLQKHLTALAVMSGTQLIEEWVRVIGAPAPILPDSLLRMAIGYRLQEKANGGLPASIIKSLQKGAAGRAGVLMPSPSATSVKQGSRLVRSWNGRTIEVLAVDGGFLFEGEHFNSLSAIARSVTGTAWSGPRFFGLTANV